MGELLIKCFGVGDGWPSQDRNHSSYLYQMGGKTVIVDCGEPLSRAFKSTGIDYDAIDAVLLSHTHGDHVGGFVMFMQGLWLEKRKRDLPFYLPHDAIAPLTGMLNTCYIFPELFAFKPSYHGLASGVPIDLANVQITPFRTTHLENLRSTFQKTYPQAFESFAFQIKTPDFMVVHSADLGAVTDLDPLLESRVDLLLCEMAHFTPEAIFSYLKDKPVKKVVFIHLARNHWEQLGEITGQAKAALPGMEVAFAKEGEDIILRKS